VVIRVNTPDLNQPPSVNAGQDQQVALGQTAVLEGAVLDDGLPDGFLMSAWVKVRGPGEVGFDDATSLGTAASFSEPGSYTLRLEANNRALTTSDEIVITVDAPAPNQAPAEDAGEYAAVMVTDVLALDATVTDDGLPDPPHTVTTVWRELSGPGLVNFADATAADTTASFSEPGTYVLQLEATDGELSASDEVTIVVNAVSSPTTNHREI
jgi:hypothetical protein